MVSGKRHKRGRPRATARSVKSDLKAPPARKLAQMPVSALLAAIAEFKPVPVRPAAGLKLDPEMAPKRLFRTARIRPFSLRFDRPEKIVGCREQAGEYHYVVQFRCKAPLYAGFTVATHEEVMRTAPWLLANYVLAQYHC